MATARSEGRPGPQWLFWLPLALVWVLPVAAIMVLVPAAREAQEAELSVVAPRTTVVGKQDATYLQAVDVVVNLPDPVPVKSSASGVVTRLDVHEGDPVVDGGMIAAVDMVPVHAWRGDVPLFRDLAKGSHGADVKAAAGFLANQGVLDKKLVSDRFGDGMDAAVKAFQRRNGLPVNGVFQQAWLVYVPKDVKAVGSLQIRVDARVAGGDTLFSGQGAPTSIRFEVVGGVTGAVPRPPTEPLVLKMGEESLPVSGIELARDERARVATALAEAASKGLVMARSEGNTTIYSGPLLAAASPTTTGSVPGTAIYVSPGGITCVFTMTDTGAEPAALPLAVTDFAEAFGQVSVPVDLAGRMVVTDPLTLDPATLATCG